MKTFPCACSFAKTLDERDPCKFPRVGMADNVLYKGHWIIRHTTTGEEAIIWRSGEPALHAEAAPCCWDWFISERKEEKEE